MDFISDEAETLIRERVHILSLKASIIRKNDFQGKNITCLEMLRSPVGRCVRADILSVVPELILESTFLDSFSGERGKRLPEHVRGKITEAELSNMIFREALLRECGFVSICTVGNTVRICSEPDPLSHFRWGAPVLAIDVSEHAYFIDYGFDKREYLLRAIPYLDLEKLGQ